MMIRSFLNNATGIVLTWRNKFHQNIVKLSQSGLFIVYKIMNTFLRIDDVL